MTSTLPIISVLLPVRDAAPTLPATLASIRAQTLRSHEVVVVDDGSTDGSSEMLSAHARADDRIRVIRTPGRGIVSALNQGLAQCRSALVARMDADDLMDPRRLSSQVAAFERWPDAVVIGCRVELFPAARVTDGMRRYMGWQNTLTKPADIAAEVYVEAPFTHPSVALRKCAVVAAGGYRDGPFPEDYELWLRLAAAGAEMRKLSATLLRWRLAPASLSRRDGRYSRDAFDRLRARFLRADRRLAAGRPLVLWGAGRRTRQRMAHLLGRDLKPRAYIDVDPRKLGNRVNGAPVLPPAWLRRREPRPLVLVCVASHGAREQITAYLQAIGYLAGEDYLAVG